MQHHFIFVNYLFKSQFNNYIVKANDLKFNINIQYIFLIAINNQFI